MPERREGNPLSREVIEHLRNVPKVVSPADERIGFMMGVGMEVVRRMINTGSLVNLGANQGESFLAVPTLGLRSQIKDALLPTATKRLLENQEAARTRAISEALYPAQVQHIIAEVGLEVKNPELIALALEFMKPEYPLEQQFVYSSVLHSVPPDLISRIPQIAAEAKERKGFLVGVDRDSIFNITSFGDFSDEEDPEFKVTFGTGGLPYRNVLALEPLGPHEDAFIKGITLEN